MDLSTYSASVEDFVALQEVGRVLHPVLAKGQIAGGVAQGIGFALYEKVVWQNGRMQNGQMTNYIMPTSADLPPIRVFFEEMGNVHGAYGAKGIGELPMDGPAPAIVNAIEDALGTRFDSVPLLPEDIFEASLLRRPGTPLRMRIDSTVEEAMANRREIASKCELSLTVNGSQETVRVFPMERLLDVLRHELELTGTKEGCGEGECGSCSVLMDGELVNSCLIPALQAAGARLTTIEGLAERSTIERHAGGFPGMRRRAMRHLHSRNDSERLSSAETRNPQPTLDEIREGLGGQSLPLHRVHADFRSRSCKRRAAGRSRMRSDPADYELIAPGTLQAVIALLADEPGQWLPIAGGTDVDGAVCGGQTSGPKTGEHLEFAGAARHRDFARRNPNWRGMHLYRTARARRDRAGISVAGKRRPLDRWNREPESRNARRQHRQCLARRRFPARTAGL